MSADNRPDFRTVSDFRKLHLGSLAGLFKQVLVLCRRAGLVRLGHVALDGTKQKANASKHKAMSYGRMKEESARLEAEIAELLDLAGRTDEEEDRELGRDVRGDELPVELAHREVRVAKIRQALRELEDEVKAGDAQEESVVDQDKAPRTQGSRAGKSASGVPDDKAQRNFTDPESRIMPGGDKSFIQGYNAQAAVDSDYQVVVATLVTNQASDAVHVEEMVGRIAANTGEMPEEMSLDAGYYSDANVRLLEAEQIDVYMPPCRVKHNEYRRALPQVQPAGSATRQRMKTKVFTDEGREKYGLRKQTVEPVFGQIKHCRAFRQFSMRGRQACEAEWSLVCIAHNLLKLAKYGAKAMAAQAAAVVSPAERAAKSLAAG